MRGLNEERVDALRRALRSAETPEGAEYREAEPEAGEGTENALEGLSERDRRAARNWARTCLSWQASASRLNFQLWLDTGAKLTEEQFRELLLEEGYIPLDAAVRDWHVPVAVSRNPASSTNGFINWLWGACDLTGKAPEDPDSPEYWDRYYCQYALSADGNDAPPEYCGEWGAEMRAWTLRQPAGEPFDRAFYRLWDRYRRERPHFQSGREAGENPA